MKYESFLEKAASCFAPKKAKRQDSVKLRRGTKIETRKSRLEALESRALLAVDALVSAASHDSDVANFADESQLEDVSIPLVDFVDSAVESDSSEFLKGQT